jgi:hypothetical protein
MHGDADDAEELIVPGELLRSLGPQRSMKGERVIERIRAIPADVNRHLAVDVGTTRAVVRDQHEGFGCIGPEPLTEAIRRARVSTSIIDCIEDLTERVVTADHLIEVEVALAVGLLDAL